MDLQSDPNRHRSAFAIPAFVGHVVQPIFAVRGAYAFKDGAFRLLLLLRWLVGGARRSH